MPTADLIHIIDDGNSLKQSLAFLLGSVKLKVRTYDSATDFLAAAAALWGGCVLTELTRPQMGGLDLLRELRRRNLGMPVIILTGSGSIPLAVEAMRAGASDFLELPVQAETLLRAVHAALDRGRDEHQELGRRSEILTRIESLSARERQVLDALVAGRPNKIIAYELGISIRTIEIHRSNLMTKMNAGSLSELVRMSVVAGMSAPRKLAAS